MKKWNRINLGILACSLLLLVSMAYAATESPKVTLDAKDLPINQAMAQLGAQANVQIVCDSDVKATINGRFESIELEKLLDSLTKSNNLTWQKLYISVNEEQKPTLAEIKARAEAVAAITGTSIVVCDKATGKQKVFIEQDTTTQSVEPDKLGLKPVYLVSKPKTVAVSKPDSSNDAAAQMQVLQDERIKLLTEMTPDERIAAYQREMAGMLQLTPEARQQFMMDQFKARQMMDEPTREALRQAMHDTFQTMRSQGLISDDGHRRRRDRNRDGEHD